MDKINQYATYTSEIFFPNLGGNHSHCYSLLKRSASLFDVKL